MKNIAIFTAILLAGTAVTPAFADDRGGKNNRPSFEELDTNKDGSLSKEEIEARGMGRFAKMDANSDGKLTAEEIVAQAPEGKKDRAERRANRMIKRFDKNEDGAISMDELPRRAGKMFDRIDANSDGKIDKAEFEAAKAKMGGKRGGHRNADKSE